MTREASALAGEKFVSLTTFKKNGDGVAGPMWIARDDDDLVVWTPADSLKVKRLRRDRRVHLVPCGRTGTVRDGEEVTRGTAVIDDDPAEVTRVEGLIKRKYGLEFRVVTFIERIAARGRKPRVVLRITALD